MLGSVFQALLAFILTGILGSWIAHVWQSRSAKETRFFEASKEMYGQMAAAADDLASLVGKRIYASQRLCLTGKGSPLFEVALTSFRQSVFEWNEQLLSIELAIRTKFRDSHLYEFEELQNELAEVTLLLERYLANGGNDARLAVLRRLRGLRNRFFEFTQQMMREARLLQRQMHFGVVVNYDRYEIDKMSTKDLIKCLFTSRVEPKPVIRAPSDFGLPVSVGQARLGIYE
jgi:hypothetical protein